MPASRTITASSSPQPSSGPRSRPRRSGWVRPATTRSTRPGTPTPRTGSHGAAPSSSGAGCGASRPPELPEGADEVLSEVVDRLDPDGEPHEVVGHLEDR